MGYLLSKPTDWETRPSDIEREGDIGRDARRSIMLEAEKAGYLTFHTTRKPNGHFENWYDAHEEPVPENERTASWETGKLKTEPGTENPQAVNGQRGTGLPLAGEPLPGSTGCGKPVPLVNNEVQNTDLQKRERENTPALSQNGFHAKNAFTPVFDCVCESSTPEADWTSGERFILKSCDLWEKPVVETDWKIKQAVKEAGAWISSRLNPSKRVGGSPVLFRQFWFDELHRKGNPRPSYVLEQWDAYDRWLIANHETHRQGGE